MTRTGPLIRVRAHADAVVITNQSPDTALPATVTTSSARGSGHREL